MKDGVLVSHVRRVVLLAVPCLLALFGFVLVTVAFAEGGTIDPRQGEEDLRVIGVSLRGWLGQMTAAGDINGDGYDDLILGAAGVDYNGRADAGAVYVMTSTAALSGAMTANDALWTIYGAAGGGANHLGDLLGHALAAGDVNNDGYDDLIIGADGVNHGGQYDVGAVYVFLGHNGSFPVTVTDLRYDVADITVLGEFAYGRLGRSVASGDVNNDGYDDIIIGAYRADPGARDDAGAVYVILGRATFTRGTPITFDLTITNADLTILGDDDGDRLGRSVASGDVNNDGYGDIIIGAYQADRTATITNTGKTYVLYGGSSITWTAPTTVDLSVSSADLTLIGMDKEDQAGFYVSSGDLNSDGYDDLLITAYQADPFGRDEAGEAYVVYGSAGLTGTRYLSVEADVTIYGAAAGDRLGRSVTSGDFNGDGYDDLLLGASRADRSATITDTGKAYLFYGGPTLGITVDLATTQADLTIIGEDGCNGACQYTGSSSELTIGDEAGRSTSAGDLNGDGVADLLIGALGYDFVSGTEVITDAGIAYGIFGDPASSLSLTPDSEAILAGETVTYATWAHNRFGSWEVTANAAYTSPAAAGGVWSGNVYTSQNPGTWTITSTWGGLTGTATLYVNDPSITAVRIEDAASGGSEVASAVITAGHPFTPVYAIAYSGTSRLGTVNAVWSGTGVLAGHLTPSGGISTTFTVTRAGTGRIVAQVGSAVTDTTGIITVTPDVLASIVVSPGAATLQPGQSYTFTAQGYDQYGNPISGITYTWSVVNGGGTVDAQGRFTAGNADGVYTDTVVATAQGVSGTASITVVNVAPTAVISGPTGGDEGQSLTFDGSGSSDPNGDPLSYAWDFGYSGSFVTDTTGVTATHTYPDDGTYTVALRVTDNDGATDLVTQTVTVNNLAPVISSVVNGGPVDEGNPVTVTVTASDVASDTLSYEFDCNNDGSYEVGPQAGNAAQCTFGDDTGGPFTVAVRVGDEDGGQSTGTTVVTVNNLPPANASAGGPYSGDEGSAIAFSGSATDVPADTLTYAWDFDYGGSFVTDTTGVTATHIYPDNGVYTVALRVTDDDGGSSGVVTATVTVSNVVPTVDAGADRVVDEGTTVAFTGTFTDPGTADTHTIGWSFGDGGTATGVLTPTHLYPTDGTFTVTLVVTDDDGGVGQDALLVTVRNVTPTAVITGSPHSASENETILFDGSFSTDPGNDIVSYEWDWDYTGTFVADATGATATHAWPVSGTYTVALRVSDDDGAWDIVTGLVYIGNTPPTAKGGGPYSGSEGVALTVDGSASTDPGGDIVSYEWDWDYTGTFVADAMGITATHTWGDNGTYTVALRVTDDNGAWSVDLVTVSITNVAPVAEAGGPYYTTVGEVITLTGSATDVPSDTLAFSWDLNNDWTMGVQDGDPRFEAKGPSVPFSSTVPGVYTVTLRVEDDDGGIGYDQTTVTVSAGGSESPAAFEVLLPSKGYVGQPFTATVRALDNSGVLLTGFSGPVSLTTPDGGTITPTNVTLAGGVWQGWLTLTAGGPGRRVVVSDPNGSGRGEATIDIWYTVYLPAVMRQN